MFKNIFFKYVVLSVFGRYLWAKNKFAQKTSRKREKLILIFTNRYVIHLVIILITLGTVTSNIMAYEEKDDYGKGALIYDIIGVENIEIIEDGATISEEPQITNYLGESLQLENKFYTEAQRIEEQIYQEQYEAKLATTQGGNTLTKPELASTEAAKVTRTSIKEYEVEEGDTIGDIATKFSITVNTILWANNLSFNSYIKPGQKLIIPPTSGVVHQIKRGDTLISIANNYDADVAKIKEFNNISDDSVLPVGETIMIPGGQIVYTARPRTYTPTTYTTPSSYTTPTVATGGKMYWPSSCQRITQYYKGWRHTGLDIACGWSKPISAAEAGVVTRVQYLKYGYGYNVIIDHGGGKQTLYGHLSRIYVTVGQSVDKAQVIALEGSTGMSTGPHLHFEVRINGSRLNPLNYLK